MRNFLKPGALTLLMSLLTVCGGGGGGGGDTASQVGFAVISPKVVNLEVYERNPVPNVTITGVVTGNAQLLNGKSLYFTIGLQDNFLFFPQPAVHIDPSGLSGNIQLFGNIPPDGNQTYSGTMTVRAYLDPSLQNQLNVDNGSFPYTIRVKTGLKVATNEIIFQTPFGTRPADVVVPITLPDDIVSWDVHGESYIHAKKADDGSSNVIVSVADLTFPSFSYSSTVWVTATTQTGTILHTEIKVTYTTDPSDVPFALSVPSANFTLRQGSPFISDRAEIDGLFPKIDSDRFHYLGASYTWPAAADGNNLNAGWLFLSNLDEGTPTRTATRQYTIELSVVGCYGSNCLPVGTYTANLKYRYSPVDGPVVDVVIPVTLAIVP